MLLRFQCEKKSQKEGGENVYQREPQHSSLTMEREEGMRNENQWIRQIFSRFRPIFGCFSIAALVNIEIVIPIELEFVNKIDSFGIPIVIVRPINVNPPITFL